MSHSLINSYLCWKRCILPSSAAFCFYTLVSAGSCFFYASFFTLRQAFLSSLTAHAPINSNMCILVAMPISNAPRNLRSTFCRVYPHGSTSSDTGSRFEPKYRFFFFFFLALWINFYDYLR